MNESYYQQQDSINLQYPGGNHIPVHVAPHIAAKSYVEQRRNVMLSVSVLLGHLVCWLDAATGE
jgi:hypothetical protein